MSDWLRLTSDGRKKPAMIYLEEDSLDCEAQLRQITQLVDYLKSHSIKAGHTVALCTASSWLINLMIHATAALGATLYPIDPKLPAQWQQSLSEQAGVDYLLSSSDLPAADIDVSTLSITKLNSGAHKNNDSKVAVVIATSGSSGEPKGVMLDWNAIHNSAAAVNRELGLGAVDCWLNCLPLHHVGGLSIIFRTVLAGASMVLHSGFDAARVWQDIHRHRVTHISLVPAMLTKLLAAAESAPPEHLRVVLIGGAALDQNLAQRALAAGWPLFVTYGMSETASQVATKPLTAAAMIDTSIPLFAEMECSVVDDAGEPTDGAGQIRLRGKLLMRGYANPEQRAGDGLDGAGWYESGDIGSYSASSGIQVMGRADEMIISGGENIHPRQVEQLMQECPGIDELCVLGIDDSEWGEKVCLFYAGEAAESEVEQWCRQNIEGALRPREFVRLEALPRLSNGKIDRKRLLAEGRSQVGWAGSFAHA